MGAACHSEGHLADQHFVPLWSAPRLRGRGKQGEHREAHRAVSTLCAMSDFTTQERSPTMRCHAVQPCLPRPRKRGTLHHVQRLQVKSSLSSIAAISTALNLDHSSIAGTPAYTRRVSKT